MTDQYKDPAWLYRQLEVEERTQTDVAEEVDVSPPNISYWARKFRENGEWPPEEKGATQPDELVFDLEVGDKVEIDLVDEAGWTTPFNVVDAPAPVAWEAPLGEDFATRRVTVRPGKERPEKQLFAAPEPVGVRVTGSTGSGPGRSRSAVMAVDSIEHLGSVSQSKRLELQAEAGTIDAGDEAVADGGDDNWRRYYEAGGDPLSFDEIETPDWLDEGSFYSGLDMADDVDGLVQALGWDDRERVAEVVAQLDVGNRLGGEAA